MCLSVYDVPSTYAEKHREKLRGALLENTRFGNDTFQKPEDDAVLERPEFNELRIAKENRDRAWKQIGTSGGGNHFVEFGLVEVHEAAGGFDVQPGTYLAVLSHSGSRGLGGMIAQHYTKLATRICQLPAEVRHLAWLELGTEEGEEYMQAMTLAGDYASACHHQIHRRLARSLGMQPLAMVENHHNYAWREQDVAGNEIIVHRKGATPAGKGVLGIIPGSMTSPGFIVRGRGQTASINSAAHGAGRAMSRTEAKRTLDQGAVARHVRQHGVELIGSGLDEAPMVYKDIHAVMDYQKDLVDVLGTFHPRVVRMCGDRRFMEVD